MCDEGYRMMDEECSYLEYRIWDVESRIVDLGYRIQTVGGRG